MILFAFDRDLTVDVSQGPVPLDLIIHLARKLTHGAWRRWEATGGQCGDEEP